MKQTTFLCWAFVSLWTLVPLTYAQAELLIQPPPASPAIRMPVVQTQSPPSDIAIDRLMQVLHITDMIDSTTNGQKKLGDIMQHIPTDGATSDETIFSRKKQQVLQKILSKYGKALGTQLNDPERRAQMIAAYKAAAKKNYTQADVNALIGFYETPMGQQLLHKQNQVSLDYIQTIIPVATQSSVNGIEQMLPSLQQDIKKILN